MVELQNNMDTTPFPELKNGPMKKHTTINGEKKFYNYRRTPHHTGFLAHFRAPGICQCVHYTVFVPACKQ